MADRVKRAVESDGTTGAPVKKKRPAAKKKVPVKKKAVAKAMDQSPEMVEFLKQALKKD